MKKNLVLKKIKDNIGYFGYHTYLITGGSTPRFLYTIGLTEGVGGEVIFAGGIIILTRKQKKF